MFSFACILMVIALLGDSPDNKEKTPIKPVINPVEEVYTPCRQQKIFNEIKAEILEIKKQIETLKEVKE